VLLPLPPPQSELALQGEGLLARLQQLTDTAAAVNADEELLGWEVRAQG
jgi:dynein heavy chain